MTPLSEYITQLSDEMFGQTGERPYKLSVPPKAFTAIIRDFPKEKQGIKANINSVEIAGVLVVRGEK
jgi:hypothetical protein